jgi:hypothetical protein
MALNSEPPATESSPSVDPTSPLRVMGPVDYLVVEFPGRRVADGTGFRMLLDLVDRGIIRILDLVLIGKQRDGTVIRLDPDDIAQLGHPDLALFDGASSGILDQSDIDEVAAIIQTDSAAAMLMYENSWAAPFATEMRRQGGQLVATGRIPIQALVAALDAADAADAAATSKS